MNPLIFFFFLTFVTYSTYLINALRCFNFCTFVTYSTYLMNPLRFFVHPSPGVICFGMVSLDNMMKSDFLCNMSATRTLMFI